MTTQHERLALAQGDYQRFLAAVVGREVRDIDRYPLTAQFLPFAFPTWRLVGGLDLPADGASLEAIPGSTDRPEGVVALGQQLEIHMSIGRYAELERSSRRTGDESKVGRTGPFRLVTVERQTTAAGVAVATQTERYALRSRS